MSLFLVFNQLVILSHEANFLIPVPMTIRTREFDYCAVIYLKRMGVSFFFLQKTFGYSGMHEKKRGHGNLLPVTIKLKVAERKSE